MENMNEGSVTISLHRYKELEGYEKDFLNSIDVETTALWESEMEEFSWLYRTDTDLFIKGVCSIEGSDREIIFVRDCDNCWYGLNDWGGQLDVDGNYFKTPEK